MDATHFRQRAARARELAKSGDDLRLSGMLLEVALDLDAEAAVIEAEGIARPRGVSRPRQEGIGGGLLHMAGAGTNSTSVETTDLATVGPELRVAGRK